MKLSMFNYKFELNFRARHKWTHFKVHNHYWYKHVVWGRISLIFGQPHLVHITVCSACKNEVRGIWAGDEGVTICDECQQIEPETEIITIEEYEAAHG